MSSFITSLFDLSIDINPLKFLSSSSNLRMCLGTVFWLTKLNNLFLKFCGACFDYRYFLLQVTSSWNKLPSLNDGCLQQTHLLPYDTRQTH